MKKLVSLGWNLRIWSDTKGQDLVEYALIAGFIAIGVGAVTPSVADGISTIFSQVGSALTAAVGDSGSGSSGS
jgi:Flp pilus assembly pilin Flp